WNRARRNPMEVSQMVSRVSGLERWQHNCAETDYLNLLPPDVARDDYVLLTFIVHGKVIREITVRQLLGSRSKLVRRVSNFSWGRGLYGIDDNGFVFVEHVDCFFIFVAFYVICFY